MRCLMRPGAPPVEPDDRLAAAAARMRSAHVGAVAVVSRGTLVGQLSEREVLHAVADGLSTDVAPVGDYMSPVPGVIGPEAAIETLVARMTELRARHLLVVSEGEVVGLVSAFDLLLHWGVPQGLLGDDG